MKIALVDDYLNKYGGAAQVLAAIHEVYPEAPIYAIFSNVNRGKDKFLDAKFGKAKIIESWFAKIPFHENLISPLRFLIPLIWSSFNFSDYDLVISSASWAITKGFAKDKTKEICYCHTPPRYLYGYETSRNMQKHWHIRFYATVVNHFMRQYDFRRAQKVTWFIANSHEVQRRIKKFYCRDSVVIHPPVEINEKIKLRAKKEDFFLTGGRLEAPKNFELIIRAVNKLKANLKVYGRGPREEYLRKIAGQTVEFLGPISDLERQEQMSRAKAFIVAATDEDFGITPVEAMAAGCPVIAFRGGGYLESVVEGKTGEFFPPSSADWRTSAGHSDQATVEALVSKLQNFRTSKYRPEDCRRQAEKFSKERFVREIKAFVKSKTS